MQRNSDRWVTPGVIVAGILTCGVVVVVVTVGLVYLAAAGRDPEPLLSMLAQVIGVVTGPAMVALQLANRASIAKAERNTGTAPAKTAELVEQRLYGAHAPAEPAGCAH